MKIVFFGTPLFAKNILEILERENEIVAVVTQPDRPFGRKQILKACEVKEYTLQKKYPIFQPQSLDCNLLKDLLDLKPEVFLVVAFGQIFPNDFLQSILCLNIHASLLPHLRGASPLQEMILEEKKEFGVSVMQMQKGLDEGEIFAMSFLQSSENLALQELSDKLSILGGKLAIKVLQKLKEIKPIKQNYCDSSICKKIKKQAGLVDFSQKIYARYLAFTPWPSIYLATGLKILKMQLLQRENKCLLGEIVELSQNSVLVSCLEGVAEIFEVQPPSKQKMGALEYVRGRHLGVGDKFC